jgi:hypothetical protein
MSHDLIKRSDAIKATWQKPTYTDPLNILTEVRDRIEIIPSVDRLQEWIQCKERLPREYEVLCCDIYKNCIVGHPFADDSASTGFSAESEGEFMYECVAWMPLPKPWEGADNE